MKKFTAQRKYRVNLRTKLLLVGLTLLVIPWVGYQYVNAMEDYLKKGQSEALLAMARAVSLVLNDRAKLFQRQADVMLTAKNTSHIFVRPLKSAIILDGYADDWKDYDSLFQKYGKQNIIENYGKYDSKSLSFEHAIGTFRGYLYVIFKVKDDKVVYRSPNTFRLDRNDHLQIAIQSPKGDFSRFLLATTAPGWVNAHYMPPNKTDGLSDRYEVKIKGEWQETKDGYNIEIRIPLNMVGNKIAFAIADVDDKKTRKIKTVIGTAGTRRVEELGTMMVPSPVMEKLLKGLNRKTNGKHSRFSATRTWVIDTNNRVIARAGSLKTRHTEVEDEKEGVLTRITRTLYQLVLKQPTSQFKDEKAGRSLLRGKEITKALSGTPDTHRRRTADNQVDIISAAYPVWHGKKVIGAVVMEQTSNSILLLQNRALENLINSTILALILAAVGLLWFATRLSGRVRRLLSDAENAIGPDGRVRGQIAASSAADELGDLGRSVSSMVERIAHYNRYLETMASKLSHELRTPLTVVKSSLDNLEMQKLDEDADTYTKRAREGVDRLSNILTRMSEASRLEQSLLNLEREQFPVNKVITGCVEGYRLAYPDQKIELDIEDADYTFDGVPDLIAQMLDKLVSNAVDFSKDGAPVRVGLYRHMQDLFITVANEGPLLPKEMQGNLFDSMVSVRDKQGELHLGLGLYIVRLIVDFHHGMVSANNLANPEGVEFTVGLPMQIDGKRSGIFGVP